MSKITRKVQSFDIILKTCTSVNLVSQNKKRIFEQPKSEYTMTLLRTRALPKYVKRIEKKEVE